MLRKRQYGYPRTRLTLMTFGLRRFIISMENGMYYIQQMMETLITINYMYWKILQKTLLMENFL